MGPLAAFAMLFAITVCQITYGEARSNITCGKCSCYKKHGSVYADCADRDLSRVPPELPNSTNWLDFTNNNLKTLLPNHFSRFQLLHKLVISGNKLCNISDEAFQGLDNLKHLNLGNNSLNYSYLDETADAFKPLRKLVYLNLTLNNNALGFTVDTMDYPGKAISNLRRLEILILDGLKDREFGIEFANLVKLEELHLAGSFNDVGRLFNETFINVKYLKVLVLRSCHLYHVEPGTMEPLKYLTFLDVSDNPSLGMTGVKNITDGLRHGPLEALYIDKIVHDYSICVLLKEELIGNLQNTSLEEFSANHNFIESFGADALPLFPQTLRRMSLRENRFTAGPYIKDIVRLEGLQEIDLSGKHRAHEFPEFGGSFISELSKMSKEMCGSSRNCHFQSLSLAPSSFMPKNENNRIAIPVPPNLKKITYSYSQLPYHIGELKIEPNSLDYVDVSSNILSTWSGPVTGLEKLRFLDLSNNLAKHCWPRFFHTFPGLETLNISDNFMGMVLYNDTIGTVFRNQSKLKLLNLRANYILSLHPMVFKGLESLEELNLADNSIHPNLTLDISHMKNLSRINCRNNQIRWIDEKTIHSLNQISENHSVYIDLSLNPIACTCYNLEFLAWMKDSNIHFENRKEYFCLYSSGKNQSLENLEDVYNDLKNSCFTYFGLSLGVLAAFVLIIALIISAIAFRYRWRLRYWYHAARLRYSKLTEVKDDGDFEFDAFVSFAEEDRDFIVNDVLPKLEDEAGIRLNFHQRDFKPGRPIATNILDAVKKSRKTLVVLSPEFLESYWCVYEMRMSKMESFDTGRDILVIVMLTQIPARNIPTEILYHIQSESYLEYPLEGSKDMFWKTLIESLMQ